MSNLDEKLTTLVTGKGVSLERRVREELEILGFDLKEGNPGRTDLRHDIDGRRAVIELKGVSKNTTERNTAQFEKWVSEKVAEGQVAKGILAVNA